MMSASLTGPIAEITQLSTAERIQLAQNIGDSVAVSLDAVSLSKAQAQELDRRLDAYRQDPQRGASWQQVQRRARK